MMTAPRASPAFDETSRLKKFFVITDQYSKIFGYRVLNSQLSFYLGICQLIICCWALAQHIYAMVYHDKILHCNFNSNDTFSDDPKLLVSVDAIIFDIGLFHSLWGIHGCVAEHLDGGYGRFAWCIVHIICICASIPSAFCSHPRPIMLWPLLIQQSIYGIGLLILTLAGLPRVLPAFMGDLKSAPLGAVLIYLVGATMSYMLLYFYWHWYWHAESEYESATKLRHNRLSSDVHADPRRRPFHYPAEQLGPNNNSMNGYLKSQNHNRILLETSPPGTLATVQMISNGTTKHVPYPPSAPSRYPPSQKPANGSARRDPPSLNGYHIPCENGGYYGPMIASPLSQQSHRESLTSNATSSFQFSKPPPPPQRHSKPIYSEIPSDLLSPQGQSDEYPQSDDSATAPILSHSSPRYSSSPLTIATRGDPPKYRPPPTSMNALKQSSSTTSASPGDGIGMGYATLAQARYAKFNNSQPISFRKSSITPGGAPFMGNRIATSQQILTQNGCSISSPSRPSSNSRHGTPILGPMYSTAI